MTDTPTNPGASGTPEGTHRGRRSLLMMAGIGFVPLLLAYALFFFFPQWAPSGTTNQGVLIQPPLAVSDLGEDAVGVFPSGKWTLLVSTGTECSGPCERAIYLVRQVNIGLGKDSDRVRRVLVFRSPDLPQALREALTVEYPEMILHFDPVGRAQTALAGPVADGVVAGKIYLVDPNGNIILYFDEADGGKPLLKDLKHLLRLSNIG